MIVGGFSKLSVFLKSLEKDDRACFVDTSILFSVTYPIDIHNDDSECAFESLAESFVPILTNQNVRAEFLEIHRKVLLAECLVDFYEDYLPDLPQLNWLTKN
jgi:hypothetical protein